MSISYAFISGEKVVINLKNKKEPSSNVFSCISYDDFRSGSCISKREREGGEVDATKHLLGEKWKRRKTEIEAAWPQISPCERTDTCRKPCCPYKVNILCEIFLRYPREFRSILAGYLVKMGKSIVHALHTTHSRDDNPTMQVSNRVTAIAAATWSRESMQYANAGTIRAKCETHSV